MPNNTASGPLEFYKKCFEIENNLTRNILKAIPPGKLEYRPHERSPSTGQFPGRSFEDLRRLYFPGGGASDIVWLFHFDEFHHRGQVSTYLRPMGARVPSTYGESGDSGVPQREMSNSPNKRPANVS